ncbi:general transcription factor 3C polypeptide 1 [Malaya genurostris]|uniref:general transcription factor 3C polypeptide 1 n=1 Tax=Malaya genurostris TaxID=325434 RepID=UPI0026F3B105|nr:general transcription factor 3C polypeptide 1 [Malaya genurostris]
MLKNPSLSCVLNEEVALEGLEGTTIDTLWNHLAIRLKMKMPLPQKFCDSVWPLIVQHKEYSFFELPETRKPFVYFDRLEHVDPSSGVMKEPKEYPGHRFKYNPVVTEDGVRGSCESFSARTSIDREELMQLTWQEVENRWSRKFVIVASQKMRESFIRHQNCTYELTIIQYCMLEWIARSRFNGETSQGKYSLVELTKDSSILYYNRKFLTDCKLVTRQSFCQRTGETSIQGMIYHLPRYYNEMKPKTLLITEKVVNILKQRPGYMADYDEIKHIVLGRAEARKWFRGNEFTKYVKTDETVPYRDLYPEAHPREWKLKSKKSEEKHVRVMRLIDPEADVYDLWYKEDVPEDDQKDGILNSQKAYIDMPVLQQAYNVIASMSDQGISQSSLAVEIGVDKLNSRAVVKNLMRLKAIEGHAIDEGRQRTTKYFIPGMSQRTVTFDKEAIQLMNTHINVMEQQQQQQQQQEKQHQEALSSSEASFANSSEVGSSYILPVDIPDDDELDGRGSSAKSGDDSTHLFWASNQDALDSIDVEIDISSDVAFMKKAQGGIAAMMSTKHISAKVLKRCNFILELVRQYQVIEPRLIQKKINQDEKAEGSKAEACHKSVLRLLSKLAVDKFLRIANVKLAKDDKVLNIAYACSMNVDKEHPILVAKIDAAKSRMIMQTPASRLVKKQLMENEPLVAGYSYDGTLAKCLRMKLFHEFLFYVVYLQPRDSGNLPIESLHGLGFEDVRTEIGQVYSTDDWKMFVPPLSMYESVGPGWVLLTDITLRLPLSIFCKICTFGFYTKELDYYLDHPIRRHMLIKQLPKNVRSQLFRQRKYIFNIFELTQKLCYAGLIQFGPQRMKDRDQTFIYINRHTALLDTRTSRVGYNEIEEKEYPLVGFTFTQQIDLNDYWERLYKIAMETRLNRRSVAVGKEILVQQLSVKPAMVEACKARTPEEAFANDVQSLPPGDNLGAAGMDTAMFMHLKSNWSKVMNYVPASSRQAAKAKRLKSIKKIVTMSKERSTAARSGGLCAKLLPNPKEKNLCLKAKLTVKPFASSFRRYGQRKPGIKVRKIEARGMQKTRKKNYYDPVDRQALLMMKKLRVDWSRNEDAILLACRVGAEYMYNGVTKSSTVINSVLYRDILHWSDPKSANKTSRSCQRRVCYMLRAKPGFVTTVKLCVEEARLNPALQKRFGPNFLDDLKVIYPTQEEQAMALKVHFVELVYMIRTNIASINADNVRPTTGTDHIEKPMIPDTVIELQRRFDIVHAHNKVEELNFAKNPAEVEEVILFKLMTLIHSAVTNVKDKSTFNIQLFNIYKNYSEKHLSQAIKMLRDFKMITLARRSRNKLDATPNIITAWDNPYRVSASYLHQTLTKIPFKTFGYVQNHYLKLLARSNYDKFVTFEDGGQGLILLMAELLTMDKIDLDVESPKDYVRMNPELKKTSPELVDAFPEAFSEFPSDSELSGRVKSAPRIKQEPAKTATTKTKIRFATGSEVYFNYVMHPIELLTKVPTEYLHFFCLLNSCNERTHLRAFQIDEKYNICSLSDCILQSAEPNLIPKCIAIALARRAVIERIKMSKVSRIECLPKLVGRLDDIVPFFTRAVHEYVKSHTDWQKLDLGKIADVLQTPINMVNLTDEIIRFEDVHNFNWLDRYEITQPEEADATLEIDADTSDSAFGRDQSTRDDISDKVHKLQNFYEITYLKMNLRLTYADATQLENRVNYCGNDVPRVFLPPDFENRHEVLTKATSDALWPPQNELTPLLKQATPLIHRNARLSVLAEFIENKQQAGATVPELTERFRDRVELETDLNTLLNFKFLLRTGSRYVTYVHWLYVQSWLLRTSCVIQPDVKIVKQEPQTSIGAKRSLDDGSSDQYETETDDEPPCKTRRQELERQIERAEERDRNKPIKNLLLSLAPWIKVDGGVNRRLLYRWLTTLLLYCISHPGVMLNVIHARFNLMAPVHLDYLLRILQNYGCLRMFAMEVPKKQTLFTTYHPVTIHSATELDLDTQCYVEAAPYALTTLTAFIGDYPKFQEDFLAPPKSTDPLDNSLMEY